MYQVTLHYVEIKEQYHQDQRDDGTDGNDLHGEVALRTDDVFLHVSFSSHLFSCQSHCAADDAP